jgi:hypothetical protein
MVMRKQGLVEQRQWELRRYVQNDDEDPELLILGRRLGSLLLSHNAMATAQSKRMRRLVICRCDRLYHIFF